MKNHKNSASSLEQWIIWSFGSMMVLLSVLLSPTITRKIVLGVMLLIWVVKTIHLIKLLHDEYKSLDDN